MAHIAVIGAGPAGLMAAETVARAGHSVTIFDQMKSPARKFLMAGLGGLNLTHTGDLDSAFLPAYFHLPAQLEAAIRSFTPQDLMAFSEALGQPTFVGSSGKIFPKSFKASPFLRAWLRRLDGLGAVLRTGHRWTDFADGHLTFETDAAQPVKCICDAVILALGGASWPRLGSDGHMVQSWVHKHTGMNRYIPSNMGINIDWSEHLRSGFSGTPLKSIRLHLGANSVDGEMLITTYGLEGSAIYALSDKFRAGLSEGLSCPLQVDLRPHLTLCQIAEKLSAVRCRSPKTSLSNTLRKALSLNAAERALLREPGPLPGDLNEVAARIKAVPLVVTGHQGLERAISSAGGLVVEDLTEDLMIPRLPGVFAAGEILNFDAPTGGYLLQAAFATGKLAGEGAVRFLASVSAKPTCSP